MMTKEMVLDGEVDVDAVKLKDIREFAKEQGLEMKFPNGMDIREALNNVADALEGSETKNDAGSETPIESKEPEKPADQGVPPFLARRKDRIEADKRHLRENGMDGGEVVNTRLALREKRMAEKKQKKEEGSI